MAEMRHEFGSLEEPGVLTPTMPVDIGARSQRQRILAAMARACAEKTFAAVTIADIVTNAGISRATFYKHFPNKRDCFDATVEDFAAQLENRIREAVGVADTPAAALCDGTAAVLDLLAANPAQTKVLVIDAPTVEPAIFGRYRKRAIDALDSQWEEDKQRHEPDADAKVAFGRAQVLLADYVAAGRTAELPNLQQELVYVALLPFVGPMQALEYAKLGR